MTRRSRRLMIAPVAAGLLLAAAAQGAMPEYEPQRRLRTALDTCLKTELMQDAYCVKKCAAGFRMETSGSKARCIGLTPDAKYVPPQPTFKPQPPSPGAPRAPGA